MFNNKIFKKMLTFATVVAIGVSSVGVCKAHALTTMGWYWHPELTAGEWIYGTTRSFTATSSDPARQDVYMTYSFTNANALSSGFVNDTGRGLEQKIYEDDPIGDDFVKCYTGHFNSNRKVYSFTTMAVGNTTEIEPSSDIELYPKMKLYRYVKYNTSDTNKDTDTTATHLFKYTYNVK